VHRQFFPGKLLTQAFGQITVEFHYMQMIERLQQRPSQCAEPGSDFNQKIIPGGMDCANDVRYDLRINKKILAEALARNVPHDLFQVLTSRITVFTGRRGCGYSNFGSQRGRFAGQLPKLQKIRLTENQV